MGSVKRAVEPSSKRNPFVVTSQDQNTPGRRSTRTAFRIAAGLAVVGATIGSAILTKELSASVPDYAAVKTVNVRADEPTRAAEPARILAMNEAAAEVSAEPEVAPEPETADAGPATNEETLQLAADGRTRWFNGRPVRPGRQYWMTVTAYSPDARSCGDSADGLTATLHSVHTNNMKLVAADTSLLPYGSMLTIPGYDSGEVVPVLDCGSAIKGRRLDLLFPTHEEARKWGRQRVLVTVWEYADGKPAENPRKVR